MAFPGHFQLQQYVFVAKCLNINLNININININVIHITVNHITVISFKETY